MSVPFRLWIEPGMCRFVGSKNYNHVGAYEMRNLIVVLVVMLVGTSGIKAESTYRVTVGPLVEYGFGQTDYTLEDVSVFDNNGSPVDVTIKSVLEFPVDFTSIGGQFSLVKANDSLTSLMFGIKVAAGMTDPKGKMTDRDWANGFEFSSTMSNMEAWAISISADLAGRITGKQESGLFWVGGFWLERYSFDMLDVEGWQMNPDKIEFSLDYPVAVYEVTWSMPYFGLVAHQGVDHFSSNLKAAFGMAFMSDQDYHLLRDFTTISSSTGFGFLIEGDLGYRIPFGPGKRGIKLGLAASFKTAKVNTTETLVFYSDGDPSVAPEDIGVVNSGIPHEVKLKRLFLGLQLVYEL